MGDLDETQMVPAKKRRQFREEWATCKKMSFGTRDGRMTPVSYPINEWNSIAAQ